MAMKKRKAKTMKGKRMSKGAIAAMMPGGKTRGTDPSQSTAPRAAAPMGGRGKKAGYRQRMDAMTDL